MNLKTIATLLDELFQILEIQASSNVTRAFQQRVQERIKAVLREMEWEELIQVIIELRRLAKK